MFRLILVLAAMIALAGGQTASASEGGTSHPALRDAIRPYSHHVSQVYCMDAMLGYGLTVPFTGEIYINQYLCDPLDAFIAGEIVRPKRQGAGIITLVHESIHVKHYWSEARTECIAFQEVDNVMRRLGTPDWLQLAVLPWAYYDHYTLIRANRTYRNDFRCQEDGIWDKTPGDDIWP